MEDKDSSADCSLYPNKLEICAGSEIIMDPSILHQVAQWAFSIALSGVSLSAQETGVTLHRCLQPQMGAQLGSWTLQGALTERQRPQHINLLEMEAVSLAAQRFLPHLNSWAVHLMCADTVAVVYIRDEGGTKSFRLTRLMNQLVGIGFHYTGTLT